MSMKKLLAFCLIAIIICACDEDKTHEIVMKVKENKVGCTGVGQMECYLVQQGNKIDTDEWEYLYDEIEGFVYEPGFVYTLLVAKERIKNPPMDGSSVKYALIRELSKEPR